MKRCTALTPRARVERVLRGEPVDKTPLTIYTEMAPQCRAERELRNAGMCLVSRVRVHRTETAGIATRSVHFVENGRPRVRTHIDTPCGELTSLDEPAGFTSWTIEKLFKGPADYPRLLSLVTARRHFPDYAPFTTAERALGGDGIVRADIGLTPLHEIMVHWMGLEAFSVEWAERRDEVLKLYAAMVEDQRRIFPIIARSPALFSNYGGNEVPEVMGKERFRQYVVPLYQEAAQELHAGGKLVGAHLDGNNRPWAADVAASDLDYVEAFTPAPDTDMTLAEALSAWPGKIVWANFPSSVHVAPLTTIRKTTRQLLREAAPGDRFILGITEDIPPDRWQENMLAVSETIDEMAAERGLTP
ncbi:MAG: hypothetical protein NT005_02215 [Spirochaetes bacterium]|nr:hypothetical protein [Spirochaetota bacterium]